MKFDIITIFPEMFTSYLDEGILARAQKEKLLEVRLHNPRDFTHDAHRTVDDAPYGGGPGMVMKIEPLVKTLESIKKEKRSKVILLSPAGKPFAQKISIEFSELDQLIMICGRYEGVDARIKEYIDEEVSVGPYVLNGGEVASMAILEATMRHIPGVLGNQESLTQESHQDRLGEYPQYTRPEEFRGHNVPDILLSGNHAEIVKWRSQHSKYRKNEE